MSLHAMNRRTFLETATTAAATTLLISRLGWAAAEHKIEKLAVQLYTVRDQMKADFDGTLAKVAQIGYKEVEFAGYFDHTGQQVRAAAFGLENSSDVIGCVEPRRHLAEPEDDVGGSIVRAVPWHQLGQIDVGFELERGQMVGVAHTAKGATGMTPRAAAALDLATASRSSGGAISGRNEL